MHGQLKLTVAAILGPWRAVNEINREPGKGAYLLSWIDSKVPVSPRITKMVTGRCVDFEWNTDTASGWLGIMNSPFIFVGHICRHSLTVRWPHWRLAGPSHNEPMWRGALPRLPSSTLFAIMLLRSTCFISEYLSYILAMIRVN